MSEPKVFFCRKCGARIVMGDKFCSGCGDKLDWRPVAEDDARAAKIAAMRSENVPKGRLYNEVDEDDESNEEEELFDTSAVPENVRKIFTPKGIALMVIFCAVVVIVATLIGKAFANQDEYKNMKLEDYVKTQQEDRVENKKEQSSTTDTNKTEQQPTTPAAPVEDKTSTNDDIYIDVPYEIDPNDPYSAILTKKYQALMDFEYSDFLDANFVRQECEKNTAAFSKEYSGRRICVSGTLDSVTMSYGDNKLTIKGDDYDDGHLNLFSIICTLSDEVEQPYLADIESDYYVAVVGQINTEYLNSGTLYLDNCVIYDFETSDYYEYSDEGVVAGE